MATNPATSRPLNYFISMKYHLFAILLALCTSFLSASELSDSAGGTLQVYTESMPELHKIYPALRPTRQGRPHRERHAYQPSFTTHTHYTSILTAVASFSFPFPASVPALPENHRKERPLYMSLKTNLLYDALAVPNIGVEFYIGKNWSINANWMYGWWDTNRRHRYWRTYGGDIAARWWFGTKAHAKPLTGHHIGLYAGIVTYDFEWGGKGYMGGLPHKTLWDRCNAMVGIEYGYSMRVSKRLNIDFTIGIGYLGGKYLEYVPCGKSYLWQSTHSLHWFGPTKAEISLVWLIGKENHNSTGQ